MSLKQVLIQLQTQLGNAKVDHAFINSKLQDHLKPGMTFLEYLDFLDEYWEIFGPPPEPERVPYTNVQI